MEETGIMMVELQKNLLVSGGGEFVGILFFVTVDGSRIEINGEKLSVKYNGEHLIGNGEEIEMNDTTIGDAVSAVVDTESVDMIGEGALAIFDGLTAIGNAEVVQRSG